MALCSRLTGWASTRKIKQTSANHNLHTNFNNRWHLFDLAQSLLFGFLLSKQFFQRKWNSFCLCFFFIFLRLFLCLNADIQIMFRMPRKISTKRQSATRISTHTYIRKTTFAAISSGNGPEELSQKPVEITRVVFPHDPPRCRSNCSSKAQMRE